MPRWYKGLQTFLARFFGGACHVFYKPTQSECCFTNGKCRSTNEYISQILRCFGKTLVAPVINHFHIVMRNFEISKHFRFKPNSLKPPAAFGLEAQPGWSTFIRPKTGSCTSKIAYKKWNKYLHGFILFFFSEGNRHFYWPQPKKRPHHLLFTIRLMKLKKQLPSNGTPWFLAPSFTKTFGFFRFALRSEEPHLKLCSSGSCPSLIRWFVLDGISFHPQGCGTRISGTHTIKLWRSCWRM